MNNKYLLAGAALLGIYLYNKESATTPTTPTGFSYPIRYLQYHPDVKLLQATLGVVQDGIIGPLTLAAWSKAYGGEIQKGYEIADRSELDEWITELQGKNINGLNKTLG